jgi:hypothetical protein
MYIYYARRPTKSRKFFFTFYPRVIKKEGRGTQLKWKKRQQLQKSLIISRKTYIKKEVEKLFAEHCHHQNVKICSCYNIEFKGNHFII